MPAKTDAEWRAEAAALMARAREKLPPGLTLEGARSKLASANPYRTVRGFRQIEKMFDDAAREAAKLYRWHADNGGR